MAGNTSGSAARCRAAGCRLTRRATHQPATADNAVTTVAAAAPSTRLLTIEPRNDGEFNTVTKLAMPSFGSA